MLLRNWKKFPASFFQMLLRNWKKVFCEFFSDVPAELEKSPASFFQMFLRNWKKVSCAVFQDPFWLVKIGVCAIFSSFIFLSDAGKSRLEGEELTFEFARI